MALARERAVEVKQILVFVGVAEELGLWARAQVALRQPLEEMGLVKG